MYRTAILDRIHYKEGWHFQWVEPVGCLRISINAKDAYTGLPTTIQTEFYPVAYDEETFVKKVLECIMKFELHECMEFFKLDEKSLFSPDHNKAPWKVPEGIELH